MRRFLGLYSDPAA